MIEIKELKKSYGDRPVLKDINLSVQAGEFLVVLGPSGAGKSTLLRCMNGLVHADDGSIVIDGRRINVDDTGRREGPRPIAMISTICGSAMPPTCVPKASPPSRIMRFTRFSCITGSSVLRSELIYSADMTLPCASRSMIARSFRSG